MLSSQNDVIKQAEWRGYAVKTLEDLTEGLKEQDIETGVLNKKVEELTLSFEKEKVANKVKSAIAGALLTIIVTSVVGCIVAHFFGVL